MHAVTALGLSLATAPVLGQDLRTTTDEGLLQAIEVDRPSPVDYGPGPGVRKRPRGSIAARTTMSFETAYTVPFGGPEAGTAGAFGAPVEWPIIGLHVLLTPGGQVLSYGTDQTGKQGAQFVYDVWDPALGTGLESHLTLPNVTATDLFCSAQSLIWSTGEALLTGGDERSPTTLNGSIDAVTIFDPVTDSLRSGGSMAYKRWYPSLVPLPSGQMLVLGGRQSPGTSAPTPELFDPLYGWRTLTGATSEAAFGYVSRSNWFYPRAFAAPNGLVFVLGMDGTLYWVDPAGEGAILDAGRTTFQSNFDLPALMYAPGKVLSLRSKGKAIVVDLWGAAPKVTRTANLSQVRLWAATTLLADGKVLVTGGSTARNKMVGVAYQTETWDPATGLWTLGATASKPRLYHSTALLLQDGSVLTGAGGAPGPVKNLNAEIYYPPYLYNKDGSGSPATRPTLASTRTDLHLGETFDASVGEADTIARVTLVRTGSESHSMNLDQRFVELGFTQSGATLTVTLPTDTAIVLPGYHMLFAFDTNGVPSIAQIMKITP